MLASHTNTFRYELLSFLFSRLICHNLFASSAKQKTDFLFSVEIENKKSLAARYANILNSVESSVA